MADEFSSRYWPGRSRGYNGCQMGVVVFGAWLFDEKVLRVTGLLSYAALGISLLSLVVVICGVFISHDY